MGWKRTLITCFISVCYFSVFVSCDVGIDDSLKTLNDLSEVYRKWVQKTKTPDVVTIPGFKTFIGNAETPSVSISDVLESTDDWVELLPKDNISQCAQDFIYTFRNIKEEWAIQMFDADAKIPSGILQGNIKWPGNYYQCSNVYAPANWNSSDGNFHGRYCTAQWSLKIGTLFLPLTTGLCVPSTCDGTEIAFEYTVIRFLIEKVPYLKSVNQNLNLTSVTCKPLTRELDDPAIGMIFLMSLFAVLVTTGSFLTIVDYFMPQHKEQNEHHDEETLSLPQTSDDDGLKNESINKDMISNENGLYEGNGIVGDKIALTTDSVSIKTEKWMTKDFKMFRTFLKCFCIFTNGSKILNTTMSEGQLPFLHGIRFLSMAWVILGHTYAFAGLYIIGNLYETVKAIDHWSFQVILQGPFSVDSFFLLSGFLLAYLFLKEMDKRGGKMSLFDWIYFYVHRYWRLTPVYMIVLGFDTVVTRFLSSGPFWYDAGAEPGCKETWWWNLLYINNFADPNKQCFGWAWYLANDMQFYIISPIFLYTLWRWKIAGLTVVAVLMGSSWLASWLITYEYDLISGYNGITHGATLANYMSKMSDYFDKMYVKPYTRISPYLIGVILGYLLYKTASRKNFLKLWQQALGWIISTTLVLVVIFAPYNSNPDIIASSFSNTFSRSTFALGLAWVIYACQTGHAVIISKILSYKLFIPLSRLTYCAYLIHPIIMAVFYLSYNQTLYFSHLIMVLLYFGFMVISYGLALITSLTFESPLMGLEKMVVKRT